MLQMLNIYVAKRWGRCIWCNGCTRMLQASVPNVSSVFSDVRCKRAYFDVVYISHVCYKFYLNVLYVLQWFFQVFSCVFSSVSDACFKILICLQKHVANVSSGCFKSRSGVAPMDPPTAVVGAAPSGRRHPDKGSEEGASEGSGGAGDIGQCKSCVDAQNRG
jgi:hypothetical protein